MAKVKEFLSRHAIKIMLLIVIIVIGAACFIGCEVESATVDTELSIAEDMTGVRQITVKIPQRTFDKYVSATWTEATTVIMNNCPRSLACTTEESNAEYTLNFELAFDSIEDYKTKVEDILGKQVDITVDTPVNVFSNGIVIQEDFSSVELLGWVAEMLHDAGYITADNADKLMASASNSAEYDGTVYDELEEYISVSSLRELAINHITINTYVTVNRTFDREIIIELPKESMDENGEAIKAYLEGNLLDGIEGTWKEKNKTCTFTASVKDKSIELIQSFTAKLLDDENCVVYYKDSSVDGDILDIVMNFNEELDFSAFSAEGSGKAPVKYNFNIEDLDEVSVEVKINDESADKFSVETSDAYTTLVDDSVDSMKLQISMDRHYDVSHVLATTNVAEDDVVSRSYVFVLSKMPTQFEREMIDTKLRAATEQYAMMETDIIDEGFCFKVMLEGTEAGVSNSFRGAFGNEGEFTYNVGENKESLIVKESIDFSDYLSIAPDTLVTYTLKVDGAEFDENTFRLGGTTVRDINIKDDTIVCNVYGVGLDMTVNGGHTDSIVAWVIIGVVAATVAVAAVTVAVVVFVKRRKTKIEKKA